MAALAARRVSGALAAISAAILGDGFVEAVARQHPRDEAAGARLFGVDAPRGEEQLHGALRADRRHDIFHRGGRIADTEPARRNGKDRPFRRDAQIAGGRQPHAAAHAEAGNRGDRRLGEARQRVESLDVRLLIVASAPRRGADVGELRISAPEQNGSPGAPVSTMTRASGKASSARSSGGSARHIEKSKALRRAPLSMSTRATPAEISTRSFGLEEATLMNYCPK